MPRFDPEHFYLWSYAGFSLIAFVIICVGGIGLLRRFRSIAVWTLVIGGFSLAGDRCLHDVGWLVVTGGDGFLDCIREPRRCAILGTIRSIGHALQYGGIASLALSISLLLRDFSELRTRNPN